jgi:hypothetical protein
MLNSWVLILYSCLFFLSQEPQFRLLKTIDIKADFIRTDNLDNIYLVAKDKLYKYDKDGNYLYVYTNKVKGKIDNTDVSNPMKILVFYKDFGLITFLDNTLSVKGEALELSRYNSETSSLACASYESGIWLYDPLNSSVNRLDKNLKLSQQSGNINQLTGNIINPVYMEEYSEYAWLCDNAAGILIFDKYGAYYKTITLKGLHDFQLIKNKIFFLKDDKLGVYDLDSFDEEKYFPLPVDGIKMIRLIKGGICVMTDNGVGIYNIPENYYK